MSLTAQKIGKAMYGKERFHYLFIILLIINNIPVYLKSGMPFFRKIRYFERDRKM